MNDMQTLMAKLDMDRTPVTIKTTDGEIHKGILEGTCRDFAVMDIGDKCVEYIVVSHIISLWPSLQDVG